MYLTSACGAATSKAPVSPAGLPACLGEARAPLSHAPTAGSSMTSSRRQSRSSPVRDPLCSVNKLLSPFARRWGRELARAQTHGGTHSREGERDEAGASSGNADPPSQTLLCAAHWLDLIRRRQPENCAATVVVAGSRFRGPF